MTRKMIPLGSVLLVAALLAALAPAAKAQKMPAPCCSITAIDARTGVVSAKVNASGAAFQFRVTDAALLKSLMVGQEVYANFTTKQVSLDGKRMLGEIISPPQTAAPLGGPITTPRIAPPTAATPAAKPAPGAPAAAAPVTAPKAQATVPKTVVAPVAGGVGLSKISRFQLCCTLDTSGVVGPNTVTMWHGTVTQGTVNGQNKVLGFSFQPPTGTCPGLAGQGNGSLFYADFTTGLLSFDGVTPCGAGIFQIEYTQTVWLDVLPIGVIYVPPGDPNLPSGAAPKQAFQVTNTFATTKNTVTVTSSGQSMTFGAKVLGVAAGGGSSSSNTVTTSDNLATSQTHMVGVIAQGPGGYPGEYDQIVWYTNPTYDVTHVSSYLPKPGPSAVLAGQIISIVPHPHLVTDPQWLFCHATVQDLQIFRGNAFACLNQIPKSSAPASGNHARTVGIIQATPAQKLLQLDPMIAGGAFGVLATPGGPQSNPASVPANSGRFQPIVATPGAGAPIMTWTYCAEDTQTPFGESNSQMQTVSTSTTTKFTSNVSLTLDPAQIASEISGVPLPPGTSSSLGVGDTWETDYTVSNSIQKGTTWTVNGNFGGGTIPAAQCQTPTAYNTTMFYDSFSSSVLFWTETVPPGAGATYISGSISPGAPSTGARVLFTPASGGRPFMVLVNSNGQYRLTLPPGNYTYQVVDREGHAMASAARATVPPKQSSPLRLPAINIGGIAGAPGTPAAAALPAPQHVSTPSVATPTPAAQPAGSAQTPAAPMAAGQIQNKPAPAGPNCTITAMDINTGVVTATENATSKSFQFKLNDSALVNSVNVGKGVYANFAAGQVSMDGITPGGTILSSTSSASTSSAAAAATGAVGQMRNSVAPASLAAAQPGLVKQGVTLPQVGGKVQIDPCTIASADVLKALLQGGIQSYFPIAANNGGEHITISSPNIEQVTCPHMAIKVRTAFGYRETRGFPQFQTSGSMELQSPLVVEVTLGGTEMVNAPAPTSNVVRAVAMLTNPQVTSVQVDNIPSWIDVTWVADCLNGKYSNWGCTDVLHAMTFDVTALVRFYLEQGGTLASGSASGAPAGSPGTLRDEKTTKPAPGATSAAAPPAKLTVPASHAAGSSQLVGAIVLPQMSYGPPRPITPHDIPVLGLRGLRSQQRSIGGVTVAHVRGVDGLEQVQGIPDGVKNLLGIHVRTLPAGESDHYIINVAQAQEWILTHPIPDHVKPTDVKTGDGHSRCNVVSWHCVEESAKHAEDEASRQADLVRKTAQDDWKKYGKELTDTWRELESCLADNTLHLDNIPVEFSITPQMDINAQTQGKTQDGSASGSISGTLGLGTQVDSHMLASLDVFYIPCLPFVVRPKAMGAVGTFGVTPKLTASLDANGKFGKTFDIPPTGDPHIPIQAIPIVIAGVPVAELDISVHFEGNIEVGGQGKLTASFEVDDPHQFAVNFICSGHGCGSGSGRDPTVNQEPPTTTETYKLQGNAHVKPDIYVALEMNFDYDAATVRMGPQPYLLAQVYGCGTATSTTSTTTTTTESHALVSDLDWGMILRTEFLVAGNKEGDGWNPVLVGPRHLWFKDLWPGGSNALIPDITGPAQANAGKPAVYNIKMPACYPFADQVKYSVALTGSTTTTASNTGTNRVAARTAAASLSRTGNALASSSPSPPCSLPAGCQSDPLKNYPLDLVWPEAGTYSLTVTASGDTHPGHAPFREFKPPQATTLNITVR